MILVSGGAGYIGSHLVHALMEKNFDILVVDNLSTGSKSLLPNGIKFLNLDILDAKRLFTELKNYKIDAIFHFAGSISVNESILNPLKYYKNNVVTTMFLLELCKKKNINKFIFSSTASVYGEIKSQKPVKEDMLCKPINPYGKSKLMSEEIIIETCKAHSINYSILRYFNVGGADPCGKTGQIKKPATHLITVACEAALGLRDKIDIFGSDYDTPDGTCIRDFIHVKDLIDAHIESYYFLKQNQESIKLNCGYGIGFSVLDVINSIKEISNSNFQTNFTNRRAGDPSFIVADNTQLIRKLKWKPKYNSLDKIVLDTISWERKLLEND